MTAVQPPGYIQALSSHTAETDRGSFNALVLRARIGGSVLKSRGGVNPALGGAFVVQQNGTPNMTVNVLSGVALVPGSEGSKQGVYSCVNDATLNVGLSASDPTNPRIDLIVAKVQDAQYSGATNSWSIVSVTGTPAGSPSAPAAPNNSVILAQVAVAANTTTIVNANITDKRPFLTAVGGIITCTSTSRPVSGMPVGAHIFETDTKREYVWDGANWYWPMPRGV